MLLFNISKDTIGLTIMMTIIILLVLKITNTVDWSWWIITLPIWLHFGLMAIGLIIFILFMIFYYIFKNINGRK